MFAALSLIGIEKQSGFGWVYKALYEGKNIDCFFPENSGSDYEPEYGKNAKDEVSDILLTQLFKNLEQ
jgi:hypothetical protein